MKNQKTEKKGFHMSHYMTALAMKQPNLRPATKIVLYWLADHHNGETGDCFPSIGRLAQCCEMDKSAVHRHIGTLTTKGLISVKRRRRDDGGFTSNYYILHLEDPMLQNEEPPISKTQHPPVAKCEPNLGSNNLGNNEVVLVRNVDQTIRDFERWWKVYPRKVGKYKAAPLFAKVCNRMNFDELMDATIRFAQSMDGQEKRFIPHPTTWLNQERWNDELSVEPHNVQKEVLSAMGLSYE